MSEKVVGFVGGKFCFLAHPFASRYRTDSFPHKNLAHSHNIISLHIIGNIIAIANAKVQRNPWIKVSYDSTTKRMMR